MENYEQLNIEISLNELQCKKLSLKNLGIQLSGYCPCFISNIDVNSYAYKYGLRLNDLLIKINEINCSRATFKTIEKLLLKGSSKCSIVNLCVYRSKYPIAKNKRNHESSVIHGNKKMSKFNNKLRSLFACASTTLQPALKCANTSNLNVTSYYTIEKIEDIADTGYDTASSIISTHVSHDHSHSQDDDVFNAKRINLIAKLIDYELSFIDFMSNGVSTFSRPLRGFFLKQQDYFALFQNIEKLYVICENFLNSMHKWSPADIYMHIGEFYNNKIKLLNDALKIYALGYSQAKSLLSDLQLNSKKFRSFLKETQTSTFTLNKFLDMPIVYFNESVLLLKQIQHLTDKTTTEYDALNCAIMNLKSIFCDIKLVNSRLNSCSSDDSDDYDETIQTASSSSSSSLATNSSCSTNSPYSSKFYSSSMLTQDLTFY